MREHIKCSDGVKANNWVSCEGKPGIQSEKQTPPRNQKQTTCREAYYSDMDITHTDQPPPQTILQTNKPRRPLRLWPGVVLGVLLLLLRFVVPIVLPEATIFGMPATVVGVLGGMFCGFAIFVWWVFFSRAPWAERLGIALLMIVALVATYRIIHVSIATGSMGYLFPVLAIPILGLAFVAAVVATNHLSKGPRRAAIVTTILLACGGWTLVRTGGFDGNFNHDFAWRWSKTPEERLLAQGDEPVAVASVPTVVKTGSDWPGSSLGGIRTWRCG